MYKSFLRTKAARPPRTKAFRLPVIRRDFTHQEREELQIKWLIKAAQERGITLRLCSLIEKPNSREQSYDAIN